MVRLVYVAGGATRKGSARAINQDAFLLLPEHGVFAVADGISGRPQGEVASRLVVEGIREAFVNENATWPDGIPTDHGDRLRKALLFASRRVSAAQEEGTPPMGSTVAAVLIGRAHATVGHMGDSRVLLLRGGSVIVLTSDHKSIGKLLDLGVDPLVAHEIGTGLDRWAGKITSTPDIRVERLSANDVLILATDGVTNVLDQEAMIALIAGEREPVRAAQVLVDGAALKGSRDDATAVVIRFEVHPEGEPL